MRSQPPTPSSPLRTCPEGSTGSAPEFAPQDCTPSTQVQPVRIEHARSLLLTRNQEITQHKRIHLGALKAVKCFFRTADDGLVIIKGCVQHDRHIRNFLERSYQPPIPRIGFSRYCL